MNLQNVTKMILLQQQGLTALQRVKELKGEIAIERALGNPNIADTLMGLMADHAEVFAESVKLMLVYLNDGLNNSQPITAESSNLEAVIEVAHAHVHPVFAGIFKSLMPKKNNDVAY